MVLDAISVSLSIVFIDDQNNREEPLKWQLCPQTSDGKEDGGKRGTSVKH